MIQSFTDRMVLLGRKINLKIALPAILLVAGLGAWLLPLVHGAYVTPITKLSAVYMGGSPSAVSSFENWRNRPADKVMIFPAGQTWSDIENVSGASTWSSTSYKDKMIMGIKMLPCSDPTANLQAGAAGLYNAHWVAVAQKLISYGESNAIIRTGWEFNQAFTCYTIKPGSPNSRVGATAANFIAYYRNIVTAMRSVAGQHFTFVWNPSNGNLGFDTSSAYPGDGYVDYIGLDSYDTLYNTSSCTASTFTNRWNNIVNSFGAYPEGLTFWDNFAKSHDKPLAFPEWGLWDSGIPYCGGGDDSQYITAMHDWIGNHNVYYESYFNANPPDGVHYIGPGTTTYPNAAATYTSLFGTPYPGTVPSSGDTTPPTITLASPAPGAVLAGTTVIKAGAVSDNVGVTAVNLRVDGSYIATLGSDYTYSLDTTKYADGTHTITLRAWDAAQNHSDATATVTINNSDSVPPSVALVSPLDGATVTGSVPVQAVASDNVGVSRVDFYLDGTLTSSDSSAPYCLGGDSNGVCNKWNSASVANGSHVLLAKAYDAKGNSAANGVTVTVVNATPSDTTPPKITSLSPPSGTVVSGKVQVSASATDNIGVSWMEIRIDGIIEASGNTDSLNVRWNTAPFKKGTHTITVTAKDAVGNVASQSTTVTK